MARGALEVQVSLELLNKIRRYFIHWQFTDIIVLEPGLRGELDFFAVSQTKCDTMKQAIVRSPG